MATTKKITRKAAGKAAAQTTDKAVPEGITRCGGKVAEQFKEIANGTRNALQGINRVVGEYIATGAEMTKTLPGKIAEAAVHSLHNVDTMAAQSYKNRKGEIALMVQFYSELPAVITKLEGAPNLSVEKHNVVKVLRLVKKGAKVADAVRAADNAAAAVKAPLTAKQKDKAVIEYLCKALNNAEGGTQASKKLIAGIEAVLKTAGYVIEEAA